MAANKLILVTGATGYVGGRLLPLLVADGWRVRCLARQPERLLSRVPAGVEVVSGDVLNATSLSAAMQGVEAAFYLVHSMGATGDFETQDREAAENFAAAARAAGVLRIIYLGGLGEDEPDLSAHLRSRHEVGERLRAHAVPVIEFRASIIIGSGSLSFEMIRALVERLPVMVMPRWVRVTAQPIAIGDVLDYLRAALTLKLEGSVVVEIGGPDQVSYGELMREYARQRGLRRWMIPVPLLTPRLSSLWLGLVTPLYARVGRKLVDSLRHPTIVRDASAQRLFAIRMATPLFVVLLLVEISDVIFAVDSIPAIFAVTKDPFIVYTSNVFAILGLRSLYFALAGVMDKFHYLKIGLGVVLTFVGVKMILAHTAWKIDTLVSLGVIVLILATSVVMSLLRPKKIVMPVVSPKVVS